MSNKWTAHSAGWVHRTKEGGPCQRPALSFIQTETIPNMISDNLHQKLRTHWNYRSRVSAASLSPFFSFFPPCRSICLLLCTTEYLYASYYAQRDTSCPIKPSPDWSHNKALQDFLIRSGWCHAMDVAPKSGPLLDHVQQAQTQSLRTIYSATDGSPRTFCGAASCPALAITGPPHKINVLH